MVNSKILDKFILILSTLFIATMWWNLMNVTKCQNITDIPEVNITDIPNINITEISVNNATTVTCSPLICSNEERDIEVKVW